MVRNWSETFNSRDPDEKKDRRLVRIMVAMFREVPDKNKKATYPRRSNQP